MSENPEISGRSRRLRSCAFVIRCTGSAIAAYELAQLLALPVAMWAAMSALIVSQERLQQTRSSLTGRIVGTLLGMAVTIVVSEIATRVAAPTIVQMALAITIAAVIAREFPDLRVVMWTCPIILLTTQPTDSIFVAAFSRGSEVILGAVVGWLSHWAAEIVVGALSSAEHASAQRQSQSGVGPAGD